MSADHRITEIETQRNFLGARCAQLADKLGETEALVAEKESLIRRLTEQLIAAQARPASTPRPRRKKG